MLQVVLPFVVHHLISVVLGVRKILLWISEHVVFYHVPSLNSYVVDIPAIRHTYKRLLRRFRRASLEKRERDDVRGKGVTCDGC